MFNYVLVIKDGEVTVTSFELEQGASKKGTYVTLSAKAGNKTIPFGKLYVDESAIAKPKTNGKTTKA